VIEVFAVEPTAAQLIGRGLAPGPHEVEVDGRTLPISGPVDAVEVTGLTPATTYDVRLDGRRATTLTTLEEPPGRLVGRLATISDLHIGERRFGHWPRVRYDGTGPDGYPMLCTAAALDEAARWGAERIVVKGDLSHGCRRREYDLLAPLLLRCPVPLVLIPGNHDGGNHRVDDAVECLARHGLRLQTGVESIDLPSLRLVTINTVVPHRDWGHVLGRWPQVEAALREAPGACLVAMHHQLMTTPLPMYLPPGIVFPHSARFTARIAAANPSTLVTSGHSHRHRRRQRGPVVITEVGSVKDHPGTWAGYLVYEGGIVQVVRRVAAPAAIEWTERTASSVLGVWGRWSPGRLRDRSFSHAW
jgi:3',5'-cyclic AMP phosphodiesterase CpdA